MRGLSFLGRSWYLVGMVVAALAVVSSPILTVMAEASEKEPAAVLAVVAGAVTVHRGEETMDGSFGAALEPGDVVETGEDSESAVLFQSGQIIELGPGSRITIGSVPDQESAGSPVMAQVSDVLSGSLTRFARTASGEAGLSALPTLRSATDTGKPRPLAPRSTLIVSGATRFEWEEVEGALEYRLAFSGPDGSRKSHKTESTTWSSPADEPWFMPGEQWTWSVEAITVDGPVESDAAFFEVASAKQSLELEQLLERLEPLLGSGDETRADAALFLVGGYARSAGFYGQAINHLERLVDRHPDRKELHRELGSLYQAVGRNDRAAEEYRLALEE